MEPVISNDYFHHVTGGADVGQYLVDACDNVPITGTHSFRCLKLQLIMIRLGSDKTHDAIVWADPKNKTGKPKYNKEITSELGYAPLCIKLLYLLSNTWVLVVLHLSLLFQVTGLQQNLATLFNMSYLP